MKKYYFLALFGLIFCGHSQSLKDRGTLAYNDKFYATSSKLFSDYKNSLTLKNPEYLEANLLLIESLIQEEKIAQANLILEAYLSRRMLLLDSEKDLQNILDFWIGYFSFHEGKYVPAERIFIKLLNIDELPEKLKIKTISALAETLFQLKKYNEANEYYLRLATDYDKNPEARAAMRKVLRLFLLEKNFIFAEKMLQRMRTLDFKNITWFEIALLSLQKNTEKALQLFDLEILTPKDNSKDTDIFMGSYYLGELLSENKKYVNSSIAFTIAVNAATTDLEREKAMINLAKSHLLEENLAKSLGIYQDFLKEYPSSIARNDAILAIGTIFRLQKEYEKSQTTLLNLINDSKNSEIIFIAKCNIAQIFIDQNEVKKAINCYLEMLNLPLPENKKAHAVFLAAEEAYKIRDLEKAVELYLQISTEFPRCDFTEGAIFKAAIILIEMQKDADAEKLLNEFILEFSQSKKIEDAYYQYAMTQKNQEKFLEAQKSFRNFVQLYPDSLLALKAILLEVEAFLQTEKYEEAIKLLENAKSSYKKSPDYDYIFPRLMELFFIVDKSDDAIKIGNELIELNPKSELIVDILYQFAIFYQNTGKEQKAIENYLRVFRQFSENPKANNCGYNAVILLMKNNLEDAKKLLQDLSKKNNLGTDIAAKINLMQANIIVDEGNYKRAIEILEHTLKMENLESGIKNNLIGRLGDLYFISNEYEKAEEIFTYLLKEKSSQFLREQILFKLSETLFALKKNTNAENYLLELFYSYLGNFNADAVYDWQYFARAAFVLADFYAQKNEVDKTIKVLSRLADLPIPPAKEAKSRVDILQKNKK